MLEVGKWDQNSQGVDKINIMLYEGNGNIVLFPSGNHSL